MIGYPYRYHGFGKFEGRVPNIRIERFWLECVYPYGTTAALQRGITTRIVSSRHVPRSIRWCQTPQANLWWKRSFWWNWMGRFCDVFTEWQSFFAWQKPDKLFFVSFFFGSFEPLCNFTWYHLWWANAGNLHASASERVVFHVPGAR